MSLSPFCLHLSALCGDLNFEDLKTFNDGRRLRRGIGNASRDTLKSMALSALNPEAFPVRWNLHGDGTSLGDCYGPSDKPRRTSQEEMLVTVRAAFMYSLPAMSIRSVTEATVAFAMRWLCSEPATATYILPRLRDHAPRASVHGYRSATDPG